MRKTIFAIMVLTALAACTSKAPVAEEKAADKLLSRLAQLQERGIMIGHQDDPVYGTSWKWDEGRSDVLEVCGDYPAVIGFDLGKIELGGAENIDGVPFDRMRKEIIAHHERGGIITLSWHAWNPVTGENSWDTTGVAVRAVLAEGETAQKFGSWLKTVADFINSLKTADGEKVPVIFRPWHEMSGSWFWWGSQTCTPEQYRQLYMLTYNTLNEAGCDNIVWAYSPNLNDGAETEEDYMKYYPGDEAVDIVGIDIYQFDPDKTIYQNNLRKELSVVEAVGEKHQKIVALTETGYQNVPDSLWFTGCLLPVLKEYPLSYVLIWRNAWDKPEENYIAAPGKATVEDFKNFYADPHTLFCKDIENK